MLDAMVSLLRDAPAAPLASPPFPPIEPEGALLAFPDPSPLGPADLVAVTRTLSPGLVVAAYRKGVFPWPVSHRLVPWVSPDPRAVLQLASVPEWPRSLRKTMRNGGFTVTYDQAFAQVIRACADERADGTWITDDVVNTYTALHGLGWAHSVEVWGADGQLAGGLYGLALGSCFAGESMFHRTRDASKVAFVALVERLRMRGFEMLDAQVMTEHLASLGCRPMPRREYLARLERALLLTLPFGDVAPLAEPSRTAE